ncbi:TPA: UDP-glucose 4-epimerase GalE, partial [Escherichia coli]
VAQCWSSPQLAADKLGWKATLNLEDMLRDSWNWQKNNPDGYER